MTRIPRLFPSSLDRAQYALYRSIIEGPRGQRQSALSLTRDDGSLNGPFELFLLNPPIGDALQELGAAIRYEGSLSPRVRELAILIVAAHWRSEYEQQVHQEVGKSVGLTTDEIATVATGALPDLHDAHEAACARLVLAMVNGDVDEVTWQRDALAIDPATIFELTALVGYYATLALQMRVFRV